MAERKAVNKYYPPDWNPSKGSINTFKKSHPLRERARKLDQGILIIRFELPFNVWCDGCNNHIGMGVRYNAEKTKTGMYHSTPIYKFRMKCHLCDSHFEIQTDPQKLDYTVLNGARRQENRWEPTENGQLEVDKSVNKKISLDPMFKLEHEVIDKKIAIENKSSIDNLEQFQGRWKDDYSGNCQLRSEFRKKKKELKDIASSDYHLLQKSSLPITLKLSSETTADAKLAKLLKLHSRDSLEQNKMLKRKQILNQSIFAPSSNCSYSKSTKQSVESNKKRAITSIKRDLNRNNSQTNRSNIAIVNYSSESD